MTQENNLQVKSKERVKDFGEVFTNPREVKAMLDLVKEESYRIDSKFLEPACGNGNFLIEILERKIKTVSDIAQNKQEWVSLSLVAASSIYGIDIQRDNVEEAVERLLNFIRMKCNKFYSELLEDEESAFKLVLYSNIIHGNGLTGMLYNKKGEETKKELMFSEWDFSKLQKENVVTRKLFSMNKMIAHNKQQEIAEKIANQSGNLFSIAPQMQKTTEMKPQCTKIHENFFSNKGE